ncbi:concanavalin A-like lectin/glucanase domain-containing protein [Mycena floridula]|nr:concanavalin A-like lectin/glucanase domain-containing protein [Mycena floridula]
MFSLLSSAFPLLLTSSSIIQAVSGSAIPSTPHKRFQAHTFLDFSSVTPGQDVASFLSNKGFSISNYGPLESSPIAHDFIPANVAFGNGTLDMKVSAFTSGVVHCAEITSDNTAEWGSVRVVYKSSTTKGIVEGNFFYLNDNQEIDFEMLTTTTLTSSPSVPAGIWATNQAVIPGTDATDVVIPLTFDPSADFHEYRIDWTASQVRFYIDGVQKAVLTDNIPTGSLSYIFNTWSSGDKFWSAGPPTTNSITHIKSIDLYQGFLPTS